MPACSLFVIIMSVLDLIGRNFFYSQKLNDLDKNLNVVKFSIQGHETKPHNIVVVIVIPGNYRVNLFLLAHARAPLVVMSKITI
jgi:hypothetical protein